jgi:hypothetical protein
MPRNCANDGGRFREARWSDMTDERPDDSGSAESDARPKRPPPTIDLDTSDVSGDTQTARGPRGAMRIGGLPYGRLLAALTGAIAALAVLGILWATGVLDRDSAPPSAAPATTAEVNALTDRIGAIERKLAAPAPDAGLRARIDALETAVNGVRSGVLAVQKQVDATSAAVTGLKSAPRDSAAPDVTDLTERIARLEQTVRTLSEKPQATAPAADDPKLRRLAIATALESEVRGFAPYADALALAKNLADDKAALAPLDAFAATGLPTDALLAQDLLAFLARFSPPPAPKSPDTASTAKSGLLDRIKADAARLVRVERTGSTSEASPEIIAELQPIAEAARRNDIALAKNRLDKLPANIWSQAQPWLDKLSGREAALKAASAFTSSAVAALAKPAN